MGLIADIVGKWSFVSSENFDEYLKEVGVGLLTRKLANTLKPTLEFCVDGDEWTMVSNSTFKNYVTKFKLGLPYDHETADGRPVTSVFTLENDKLIQSEKGRGGKDSIIERYIDGGNLVIKCTCGTVTSIRKYTKA